MRTLVLVRHAQSVHHVQGRIGGWSDWALSALGCQQARRLAACLAHAYGNVSCKLASSDLLRAVQTAEAIGQALGVAPVSMPELRSCACGIADGMFAGTARQHFIQPTEPLPDWVPYPGAETWRQVHARVIPCVECLIQEDDDVVIVVSHKIPIHLTLCWWLGLPLDNKAQAWFDTDPASLTTLRVEPWGGHTVARVNDTAHL